MVNVGRADRADGRVAGLDAGVEHLGPELAGGARAGRTLADEVAGGGPSVAVGCALEVGERRAGRRSDRAALDVGVVAAADRGS